MSEKIATFIYHTANPIIQELAKTTGHKAYIDSLNSKKSIPEWKTKFENLMENFQGETFTFKELEKYCQDMESIQLRYRDIILALYLSLKPHYG